MRQHDISNQGHQARPSNRATLAGRLEAIHPADLQQGLQILAEFAGNNMHDSDFISPYGGTHSEAEELATTLQLVWRDKDAFDAIVKDYIRLVGMVREFCAGHGDGLAVSQLDRIAHALAVDNADAARIAPAPAPSPIQRPGLRQLIRDRAVIAAAVLLAAFLWAITSDHCEVWHMLAAIALVAAAAPAIFRIGVKHGRDVLTAVEHKS